MKKTLSLIAVILFALFAHAQPVAFPDIEQYQLSNGLKVYLIEYGGIPTTTFSLFVNCGKRNETPGRQLYSQVAASCVNFGSEKYNKSEEEGRLFKMGTHLSAVAADNYTIISSSFLNKDLEDGLDIYTNAILHPAFPEKEISQYQLEVIDYNNIAKVDIGEQAAIFSNFWVYGSASPFGRYFYKNQLSKLAQDTIEEFYKFNYTPGNSRLVICGKIDKTIMKSLVQKYFGSWIATYGEVNGASYETPVIKKKEFAFINRADATQAALLYTKSAPDSKSKEVMPFMIANIAFNDVLFKEVRGKGGKTYGIYSSFSPYNNSRLFKISTQVRQQEMMNTVKLVDSTLNNFYATGINRQQMDKAVKSLKNEWLMIEDPPSIISFFNPYVYPKPEEREKYLVEISKLTLDDVNKIIKKYFTPDIYKLMIAGNENKLNEQLKQFPSLKVFKPKDIEVDQ